MTHKYKFNLPSKAIKLTASQLAKQIGVSRQAAYSLLRPGTAQIKIETINKICAAFGVSPAELFSPLPPGEGK